MASLLDIVSAGAGTVFGGPAQNKLAAAAVVLKSKANDAAQSFGEKLGKQLGPDIFDSLSAGAGKTASQENQKIVNAALSTPGGQQLTLYIALGALVALYFAFKKWG